MPTLYFEISDILAEEFGGKYFSANTSFTANYYGEKYFKHTASSDRVWCEDADGRIYFLKNRYDYTQLATVNMDMKEFMWIKLSAKTLV